MANMGRGQVFLCVHLRKTLKNLLSENAMPRSLIFGMVHYLVDLFKIASNFGPGPKSGPVNFT